MSLETDLHIRLTAICPRVFPDVAPGNTTRPYITWQQIGGRVLELVANEVPNVRHADIQINVWSSTRAEAVSLAQQIEAAMIQSGARPNSAHLATYEEDLNLYGTIQDFSVWATR